jgi:type II secretory pathway pseudopilin PulG
MAISSTSASQGISSGLFAQIQQQQARRNADQADQQARALQSQAQTAQAAANRAQENARSLKVQANQAQGDASSARQNLSSLKSLDETQNQLSGLRDQIRAVLNPDATASASSKVSATSVAVASTATMAPVINSSGQATGTLVNVIA